MQATQSGLRAAPLQLCPAAAALLLSAPTGGSSLLWPLCWKRTPDHPAPTHTYPLSDYPQLPFVLSSCFRGTDSYPSSHPLPGRCPHPQVSQLCLPLQHEHPKDEGDSPQCLLETFVQRECSADICRIMTVSSPLRKR